MATESKLHSRLTSVMKKHRDLDEQIFDLQMRGHDDQKLKAMKIQKLKLKEDILSLNKKISESIEETV